MFYLTKRVDEKQCTLGDVCMTLCDWPSVPAGTRGVVTEIYSEGVVITWPGIEGSNMSRLNTIETIGDRLRNGEIFSAARGWISDGFSRDDLQYLAFATAKHPEVDPTVYNPNIHAY